MDLFRVRICFYIDRTSIMSSLEIATKATLALVLPSLLIAIHLRHVALLLPIAMEFQGSHTVDGKEAV